MRLIRHPGLEIILCDSRQQGDPLLEGRDEVKLGPSSSGQWMTMSSSSSRLVHVRAVDLETSTSSRLRSGSHCFKSLARPRAVQPVYLNLALMSAPRLKSDFMTSTWPLAAAKWRAVNPPLGLCLPQHAPGTRPLPDGRFARIVQRSLAMAKAFDINGSTAVEQHAESFRVSFSGA